VETNQIVGIALVVAGCSDLIAIPWLRSRLAPERARVISAALGGSALFLIGLGVYFLMR
jgi:hypothetical protein